MPLQTIKCTDKILTDKDKDIITEEINAEYLKEFIYYIWGVLVMLDMDLAKIYGYSTKDFNRQVKNNIEKFEQDFMFQLIDEECEILRCKNSTSSWGGRRYNPYAFTEQGIYMLMTVLKGELATKQSKALKSLNFSEIQLYFCTIVPVWERWCNRLLCCRSGCTGQSGSIDFDYDRLDADYLQWCGKHQTGDYRRGLARILGRAYQSRDKRSGIGFPCSG